MQNERLADEMDVGATLAVARSCRVFQRRVWEAAPYGGVVGTGVPDGPNP